MKMVQKIAFCIFAAFVSNLSYAEVIQLDAVNPDICRKQLMNSKDELPIIATYDNDHGYSFMKKLEVLAQQHPERTFFKWNASDDTFHLTQSLCLQRLGFIVEPNIIVIAIWNDWKLMTSPLRLQWAGKMTLVEMNQFIDVPVSEVKKILSMQKMK